MKQTLILMLSILLLASCDKKDDSEAETKETCLVKQIELLENNKSEEKLFLTYNDKGQVTRIDHGSANSNDYETYEYQAGKIVMFDKVNYNGKSETISYTLDGSSRIISAGNYTFKYNADGYLSEVKETQTGGSETTTFTYTSGNLTKAEYSSTFPGAPTNSTIIEYSTDAYQSIGGFGSVLANFTFNEYGALTGFFGKASKNLVSKDTFKSKGYPDDVTTYTYTKDSKGNVTSLKLMLNGDNRELKFTYECK